MCFPSTFSTAWFKSDLLEVFRSRPVSDFLKKLVIFTRVEDGNILLHIALLISESDSINWSKPNAIPYIFSFHTSLHHNDSYAILFAKRHDRKLSQNTIKLPLCLLMYSIAAPSRVIDTEQITMVYTGASCPGDKINWDTGAYTNLSQNYLQVWWPFYLAEWGHFAIFVEGIENFCEIILILDQWLRISCLQLWQPLRLAKQNHLCNFGRGRYETFLWNNFEFRPLFECCLKIFTINSSGGSVEQPFAQF